MALEYAMQGYLTNKADVYSFGVVLLEIVCGRNNTSIKPKEELLSSLLVTYYNNFILLMNIYSIVFLFMKS